MRSNGEKTRLTAEDRARDGKVFFVDPRGVGHAYDPLQRRITEDELRSSAEKLLFEPGEGERGTVFSQRAAKMLTQMFRAARIEEQRPIPYAAYLLHLGPIDTAIRLDAVSRRAGLPPDHNLATRFLDVRFEHANFNDPFFQSAWSTLSTKMDPVITETVIKTVAGSDFTPEDLIAGEKPVTVYLRFPELHLHALSPLIRLIWSSLIEELNNVYDEYKREKQEKRCRPVLLAIDEAGRAPVPGLPDYSSTVAGRRITLWIAVQSLTQLDAVYGTKRAGTLLGNIFTQVYFKPADDSTAERLEKKLYYTSAYARSKTTHGGAETSEGESEQKVPVLSSWEIRYRLGNEEILGFTRDTLPFRVNRMSWLDFPHLKKELENTTPPSLPPLPDVPDIPALSDANDSQLPDFIDPDRRN